MVPAVVRRVSFAFGQSATLADVADRLAGAWGDRRLMTSWESSSELTYRDAATWVERASAAVAEQIDAGDTVVIATPNSYDQLLWCFAVARAGGLPVPINAQMRDVEVDHVIADSQATLVIRSNDDLRHDAPAIVPASPNPSDPAALFYTSGTTGRPKGAVLTHRALVGQTALAALWPAQLRNDEVVVALPVAHIMGFVTLIGMATAGIPVCFLERFRPADVLDALESRRSSGFIGVPAMYRMMLEGGAADRDLKCVRFWGSGADVMPTDVARQFKSFGASASLPMIGSLGEATFVEGYGMVEVGGGVAAKVSLPYMRLGSGDSVGVRLPGYRLKVVDDDDQPVGKGGMGELWVKGPGVLEGYWNAPDATAGALTADGWLRTGDLARVGPMGTIVFCGRRKHVIKSGGYSVYPVEVESVLEQHPAVAEAAVIGLAHDRLGEVPVAVVRLHADAAIHPPELLAWATEQLAHYKAPRRVVIVDELPRTGTDKVQKDRLTELFD